MSLLKEQEVLQAQIEEITRQIFMLKDELLEYYDSDHLTPNLPHHKRKMSLAARDVSDDDFTEDALKCCFYQTFMTAREKLNSKNIVVTFPTEDKTVYGVELKHEKNEKMSIEKINLPLYISPQKLFKNRFNLSVEELVTNLNLVYKCIVANKIRASQINELKSFDNKIGLVSISPCSQVLRIRTTIETKNGETNLYIVIRYKPTNFRPSQVSIQIEKDVLTDKTKKRLKDQLKLFKENDILNGYKAFFNL